MSKVPKASSSPPEASDATWLQYVQTEKQKAPERLEEAAKFLVGITSISLTIFLSGRPADFPAWAAIYLNAATIFWILSTVWGIFVLFPWRYAVREDSPEDIKRAHTRLVFYKRTMLVGSLFFFLLALCLAAWATWC